MQHFIVRLALEWFRASGGRTRARLDGLVDHFARNHEFDGVQIARLQGEAWDAFADTQEAGR